jgi:cytochrome P450
MLDIKERDYFTDHSVLKNSNSYFKEMLAKGPVINSTIRDLVIITGYEEAISVLLNANDFSSVICAGGPIVPLPFVPEGSDISAQIEKHRAEIPATLLLVTYDGAAHANSRFILNKLFVPSRLKANEQFMEEYTEQIVRQRVKEGAFELMKDLAVPYVTDVVAELLGVPADDRDRFKEAISKTPPPGDINDAETAQEHQALMFIASVLAGHIYERRENPRGDILSELATATFPDGSLPDANEVIMLATFLFAAGQDTSAKLLGNCMRFLVEDQGLQQNLREHPERVPDFIEEVLRMEGSTKATFRIAVRDTVVGGVPIPAGKRIAILLGAANLDARRWEDPDTFKLGRPKNKEHLAYGRGKHTCVGAPLARLELRCMIQGLLRHTSAITLSEEHHGAPGNRNLEYDASYIIRGLDALHLKVKPNLA